MKCELEKGNFIGISNSKRREADVLIHNFSSSGHEAVDYCCLNPEQEKFRLKSDAANFYAQSIKYDKFGSQFENTGINYTAVAMETTGGFNDDGYRFLKKLFSLAAKRNSITCSYYISICWQRLSVKIQKAISRMVLKRIGHPHDWVD